MAVCRKCGAAKAVEGKRYCAYCIQYAPKEEQ